MEAERWGIALELCGVCGEWSRGVWRLKGVGVIACGVWGEWSRGVLRLKGRLMLDTRTCALVGEQMRGAHELGNWCTYVNKKRTVSFLLCRCDCKKKRKCIIS